ncbi:VOC family protein [Tenacibaculum xiamenense]|uniref:VOC family protein n=1 Tax=Tenacibaculum xiamenense TaxID=1261553 RepID=UPI0038939F70
MEVNLIVIRSDKPKELSSFYTMLGLTFRFHQHGNGPWHYATEIGNIVFEIYPLLKTQLAPDISTRLGFVVNNLESTIEKLKASNITVLQEPKESEFGYFAVIKDLDWRKIELKENNEYQRT